MPDKYIVFKREDYEEALQTRPVKDGWRVAIPEIPDAVVLRLQDVFTEPALHVYATSIAAFVQLLRDFSGDNHEAIKDLQQIADYFEGKAQEAVDWVKRLPTL